MIDFLHAVDWVVPSPLASAHRLADVLGLPQVRKEWQQVLPTHGYDAVFSRVGGRMGDAPTRLEFISSIPVQRTEGCSVAPFDAVVASQGRRPQKTHASVVCVRDFDVFIDEAHSRGTPVWVEPGCHHLPHRRAWFGWSPEGPSYDASFDGGIFLEAIPTTALGEAIAATVAESESPGRDIARVIRRVHMVSDLTGTVRALERSVGMEPDGDLGNDNAIGITFARYRFGHRGSAALEVAQPLASGFARDYFDAWGPGPLLTTFQLPDPTSCLSRAIDVGVERLTASTSSVVIGGVGLGGVVVEVVT